MLSKIDGHALIERIDGVLISNRDKCSSSVR